LQTAWFTINDTYRSELCLLYPPHMVAVAGIYLTLVLSDKTREGRPRLLRAFPRAQAQEGPTARPRRHRGTLSAPWQVYTCRYRRSR